MIVNSYLVEHPEHRNTIDFRTFLLAQMIGTGKTTFAIYLGRLLKAKFNLAAIEEYTKANLDGSGSSGASEFDEGTQKLGLQWWKSTAVPELKKILGQQVLLYL
jgi:hypothetical protein